MLGLQYQHMCTHARLVNHASSSASLAQFLFEASPCCVTYCVATVHVEMFTQWVAGVGKHSWMESEDWWSAGRKAKLARTDSRQMGSAVAPSNGTLLFLHDQGRTLVVTIPGSSIWTSRDGKRARHPAMPGTASALHILKSENTSLVLPAGKALSTSLIFLKES